MAKTKPDGINVLDVLLRRVTTLEEENSTLRHALSELTERINGLTFNIGEEALNQIAARTLNIHAQVLLAATKPVEKPQEEQELAPA